MASRQEPDMLKRAFELAYFIHSDADLALRVTTDAIAKVEVTAVAQDKRLYYTPAGRTTWEDQRPLKLRTKVYMSELHLLQRLVYSESEAYERQQEQAGTGVTLDEEDMIVRFIKHLVKITVRRNSFYVALGVSRLLHSYSTAETMNLYGLIVQDPNRVRDDYYYRSRKRQLMQEIQTRFGNLVRTLRGHRGEERFDPNEDSSRWTALVGKCLDVFTPWDTGCVVPQRIDPTSDELSRLAFKSDNPDAEHPIELNRIHSILHPACFARLTDALRCGSPDERLDLPRFFVSGSRNNDNQPRGSRGEPPELSEAQMAAVAASLSRQAERRRGVHAGSLSISVDGVERARLDVGRSARVKVEIDESSELIEVKGRDSEGELLLAAFLVDQYPFDHQNRRAVHSILLEGGQRISFDLSPTRGEQGDISRAVVDISYRETSPARVARLFWRQFVYKSSDAMKLPFGAALRPAWVMAAVAILIAGFLLFQISRRSPEEPPVARNDPPAGTTAGEPATSEPPTVAQARATIEPGGKDRVRPPLRGSRDRAAVARATRRDPLAVPSVPDEDTEIADLVSTRGLQTAYNSISLVEVKSLHIDSLGQDEIAGVFRRSLALELDKTDRFEVIEQRDQADAVIKGSVHEKKSRRGEEPELILSLKLVNVNGDIIWSIETKKNGLRQPAAAAAARVSKILMADVKEAERRKG